MYLFAPCKFCLCFELSQLLSVTVHSRIVKTWFQRRLGFPVWGLGTRLCIFSGNMILTSCKMICSFYLTRCQAQEFEVQLLLNTDDRALSTVWKKGNNTAFLAYTQAINHYKSGFLLNFVLKNFLYVLKFKIKLASSCMVVTRWKDYFVILLTA